MSLTEKKDVLPGTDKTPIYANTEGDKPEEIVEKNLDQVNTDHVEPAPAPEGDGFAGKDPTALIVYPDGTRSFSAANGDRFGISPSGCYVERFNTQTGKPGIREPLISTPIEVTARISSDATGSGEGLVVRYKDRNGILRTAAADLEDIRFHSVTAVASLKGLQICGTIGAAQGVAYKIANMLNSYPWRDLPVIRGLSSFGWVKGEEGAAFYAPPGKLITRDGIAEDGTAIYTGTGSAPDFSTAGTFPGWQNTIGRSAATSSRIGFAVSASFAATLLPIYPEIENSFGFNIWGDSSKGKSTALRAGLSVWCNPGGREATSWRGSPNGFEALCEMHNGFLLGMDEIGQGTPSSAQSIVYNTFNGMPKARMGKDLKKVESQPWRLIGLSTGEMKLEDFIQSGANRRETVKTGAQIRLADIPVVSSTAAGDVGIFDHLPASFPKGDMKALQRFASGINEAANTTYGTAGLEWVGKIIRYIEVKSGLENFRKELKQHLAGWVDSLTLVGGAEVIRVARYFGFVAVAGELAIKLEILPPAYWSQGMAAEYARECFRDWLAGFKTNAQKRADAVEEVIDAINQNLQHYVRADRGAAPNGLPTSGGDVFGRIVSENSDCIAFTYPKVFRDRIKPEGISTTEIRRILKDAGRLKSNEQGLTFKSSPSGDGYGLAPNKRYIAVKVGFLDD